MDLPAQLPEYTRYTFADGALSRDGKPVATPMIDVGANGPLKLEVIVLGQSDAAQAATPLRLQIEPNTRVCLVERHLGHGNGAAGSGSAIELTVGAGAAVSHYRVQQTGADAQWHDALTANLAADAAYGLCCINLGGRSAHSQLQLKLAGERAQLALHAVSLASGEQVHEMSALVEHAARHTRTEENFRGIANGHSRVAFNGKIVVREGAHGAHSQQSLRGLIADSGARVDVQPHLEIYTDDVKCSHGATAGKLDENMLFYLLSRGLDASTAQQLLKWAFLEDVVSKIEVPQLRRQIELSLAGQMSGAQALQELL